MRKPRQRCTELRCGALLAGQRGGSGGRNQTLLQHGEHGDHEDGREREDEQGLGARADQRGDLRDPAHGDRGRDADGHAERVAGERHLLVVRAPARVRGLAPAGRRLDGGGIGGLAAPAVADLHAQAGRTHLVARGAVGAAGLRDLDGLSHGIPSQGACKPRTVLKNQFSC